MTAAVVQRELRSFLPHESVLVGTPAAYLVDETETRGVKGRADAVVVPGTADEVAEVVRWCYDRGVPIIPRGGGTGFAAGAVPLDGGVVVSLERLTRVRMFDPLLWRIFVEAGLRTAELRRIVRESGLFFPPDPGAAEQSQIGGNIATNAGGPHAFKYGVTSAWVTGLEAVLPPGEIVSVGGAIRKDVAAANPQLPLDMFRAFVQAKAIAMADLNQSGVLKFALPWLVCHYAETRRIMGPNIWAYGFRENRDEIAAMTRYAHQDGLAARIVDPAELFHPTTLDAADMA